MSATLISDAKGSSLHESVEKRDIVKPKKKTNISPLVSLTAGAVAGGVEASVTYPFEFAKTRLQLRNAQGTAAATKNPLLMIQQIAKSEGITGLYTGCSTLVIGTALKAGVRFLTFDTVKALLSDPQTGVLTPTRGILAGAIAGGVESVLAVTPTERIKTALIDDARGAKRFKSPLHGVRVLIQEQGLISGLYKGLASTTLKQSATSAVRMGSYNMLKESAKRMDLPTKNAGVTFAMGAVAGTITVYATQPFDTMKTRAQSVGGASTVQAFRSILADTGIRGFWKGSSMRLGRLVLSGGIVFSVYESVVAALVPSSTTKEHQ